MSCVGRVRRALEGVTGVKSVKIDFDAKKAHVDVEAGKVSADQLKAAVEKAGYGASME